MKLTFRALAIRQMCAQYKNIPQSLIECEAEPVDHPLIQTSLLFLQKCYHDLIYVIKQEGCIKTIQLQLCFNQPQEMFSPLQNEREPGPSQILKRLLGTIWGRTIQLLANFLFLVSSNSPRILCKSYLYPVSPRFLSGEIAAWAGQERFSCGLSWVGLRLCVLG